MLMQFDHSVSVDGETDVGKEGFCSAGPLRVLCAGLARHAMDACHERAAAGSLSMHSYHSESEDGSTGGVEAGIKTRRMRTAMAARTRTLGTRGIETASIGL
mmetsp:Transcript_31855/g.83273  ORF Transcript_31855/g.83273 Transcript_31855/m.83273 type:complete len:102 (+) Transcript_31855:787-1092(+)